MFSRRPDRPKEEPRLAPSPRPSELVPVPPSGSYPGVWGSTSVEPASIGAGPGTWEAPSGMASEATVVAERDHIEGALRSGQGVLVLGSFSGSIESESWIRMGEESRVQADVTADEVVVAGRYEGRLIARSRLEITATGHVLGDIEAPRLQLHEGGVIDGALSMTTHAADRRVGLGPGRSAPEPAVPTDVTPPTSVRADGQGASPRSRAAAGGPNPEPAVPEPPIEAAPRS